MTTPQVSIAERCDFMPGDCIDGVWKVDAFLGEGTFGQVFRVKGNDGNTYALKLLKTWQIMASERPNLLKRFEREYEAGRIVSDYLVHSLQKGIVKGNAYIVMEYCAGGDLHSALKKTHLDLALLARHILLGLRDLHINGKVHRDLKPENVLLRDNSHAALTDFGISGDQNNRLTQRGWSGVPQQRFGTIAYMPPEQINPKRGNATVLPTTDIFSFGVMMYQLLTGSLPFGELAEEADVPRYVHNGQTGQWNRKSLGQVADGTQWLPVIEGCLVPDFKNRLQTIDDVLALLPKPKGKCEMDDTPLKTMPFKRDDQSGLLLRVMQGEEQGKVYCLNELFTDNSTILCMGRAGDDIWNHIGITENESCYISRQHCTIEKDGSTNSWVIRDGQFRAQCPIGLRSHHIFPCTKCTARCAARRTPMRWKESLNGTYVNSDEVPPSGVRLSPGDIISIGDVKMRVEGV